MGVTIRAWTKRVRGAGPRPWEWQVINGGRVLAAGRANSLAQAVALARTAPRPVPDGPEPDTESEPSTEGNT